MSQPEETKTTPEYTTEPVERVRKVFVRDLSLQQKVHTVFCVARKSRHVARSGKAFLALSLVDKTGEIPGRIFDNVETADAAFQESDYLLLRGTVINFRGKPQLVVEQLERLAAEPIDASEFIPPTPPAIAEKPAPTPKNKNPKASKTSRPPLASPHLSQALEMLCSALETFIQEKIELHLANATTAAATTPLAHKPPMAPKAESKTENKTEAKTETPGRGLPKAFAFKPFNLLTAEESASAPPAEPLPSEPPPAEPPPAEPPPSAPVSALSPEMPEDKP
ncbi:MAG: hypothetical protein FWG75_10990 [Cystobacterineae bacterium]|nr:hypothetical protein [Cystobacterineae bacterium]